MHIKIYIISLFFCCCYSQRTITIPSVRKFFGPERTSTGTIRLPVISNVAGSQNYGNFGPIPFPTNSLPAGSGILTAGGSRYLAIPTGRAYSGISPVAATLPSDSVLGRLGTLGLSTPLTGGIPLGASQAIGPVIAAIITQRTAEVVDIPTPPEVIQPQVLIVEPNQLPVTIEFRSQSSPVNVNQVHIPGAPGEVKATRSEEEPDRVLHEVVKPVIQEVREIIQPFRKITQEILPVQEEVHSIVARGEGRSQQILEAEIPPPQPIAAPGVVTATVLERVQQQAPAVAFAAGPVFATQPVVEAAPVAVAAVPVANAIPLSVVSEPFVNNILQQNAPFLTGSIVQSGTFGTRVIAVPGSANGITLNGNVLESGPRIIKRQTTQSQNFVNEENAKSR